MDTKKMRACSALLPDPGGEVVRECLDEIERLRTALGDIINPIGAMQRDLEDGYDLNGAMAVAMANDPEHYKRIARAALTPNDEAHRKDAAGGLSGGADCSAAT